MRDCDLELVSHAGFGRVCGVCVQGERCVDAGQETSVGLWSWADVAEEHCLEGVSLCLGFYLSVYLISTSLAMTYVL